MRNTALISLAVCVLTNSAIAQSCHQPVSARALLTPNELKTVVITGNTPGYSQTQFNKDFSLSNTLGKIIETANPDLRATSAEKIALLNSLIRSFLVPDQVNPDSGVRLRLPRRAGEAALDPIELLANPDDTNNKNAIVPVALFNRWDLAPGDYKYCGEHRIVYARKSDNNNFKRFFLIFEAGLDNPDLKSAKEGCKPVVDFWKSLPSKSDADLAKSLRDFYYSGLDTNQNGTPEFQPVIHHQHFGIPYGQVRGNLFVVENLPLQWQLREWRTTLTADGAPVFTVDTVKKNPHAALFGPPAPTADEPGFAGLRRSFQVEFLRDYVVELTALEQGRKGRPVTGNDLIDGAAANFANKYSSFHSDAGGPDDSLQRATSTELPAKIEGRLNDITDASCRLTKEHILNRASVQTCAGCHQPVNRTIAPGVDWPAQPPIGANQAFVHVNETGMFSSILLGHFLPFRHSKLISEFPDAKPSAPIAALTPQSTRRAISRVFNAESKLQSIDALRDLESSVQTLRAQDANTPGAFTSIRRVH